MSSRCCSASRGVGSPGGFRAMAYVVGCFGMGVFSFFNTATRVGYRQTGMPFSGGMASVTAPAVWTQGPSASFVYAR